MKNFQGKGECMVRVKSSVPLMHHDADRSKIADRDPDQHKGTHPKMLTG